MFSVAAAFNVQRLTFKYIFYNPFSNKLPKRLSGHGRASIRRCEPQTSCQSALIITARSCKTYNTKSVTILTHYYCNREVKTADTAGVLFKPTENHNLVLQKLLLGKPIPVYRTSKAFDTTGCIGRRMNYSDMATTIT
jgi:hypothetical protein